MTKCTRFEDEGLLALELGEALSEHFSTCTECVQARKTYQTLIIAIADMDANDAPADNWQQEVLQSIGESEKTSAGKTFPSMAKIAASIAVLAIAALLVLQLERVPDSSEELVALVVDGDTIYRGVDAKVGDSLQLSFGKSKAPYSELRVYRDNRIYHHCDLVCIEKNRALRETIVIDAIGEYQSVLIQSDEAIPLPAKILDTDILLAREQGAKVVMAKIIIVR